MMISFGYFIFLITLGVVYGAPKELTIAEMWEELPPAVNGLQCMYLTNDLKFVCRG